MRNGFGSGVKEDVRLRCGTGWFKDDSGRAITVRDAERARRRDGGRAITVRNKMSFWSLYDYGEGRAARIYVTRHAPGAVTALDTFCGIEYTGTTFGHK